jgi:hypothetical protein
VLRQPPNSPDLPSTNFVLFPKLKDSLEGSRSVSVRNTRKSLEQLTQFSSEPYVAGWEEWTCRVSSSIDAQEGSFEGINVQYVLFHTSSKSSRSDQGRYEVDDRKILAGPSRGKSNFPLPRPQMRPAHNPIQWAPTRLPGGYSKRGSAADNLHLTGR